jgi:PAS domain S-box-containing protein
VAFNPAAERMFGYLKQEVEGRNVAMLMAEPYATEHSRYVQSYERTKEARAVGRIRSVAGKRKNGEVFPIELSVADVDIDERVPYGAFIRDISEKVRLEARLLERERLASIGTMASMLAHEIGNPLNNMYLHAQILERRLKQHRDVCGEQVFRPLESLLGEIRRLMQLLEEFRSVSRRQTLSCHPTDVSDFVHGVLSVVAPDALQRNVTVDSAVGQDVVGVMDAEKIKQVVLNLCKNAIEAMPSGGTLRVASRLENGEVVIEIADTGVGIPQTLDVFEAFTTTKPEGTGLGLAISRQLVKAHGGSIQFASEVGRGTVFTVRLPADGPPPE